MAEVVEQKPIGIPIGIDGSFSNTEFKDGVLQIKESSLDPLEYHPMGLWTSKITDIGDNFKEYGKIIVTSSNKNGSRVEISTRSSADGVSFSVWQRTTDDGSIISPKNKFIQVRLALYAGATISNIDIANDEYLESSQFVESVVYQDGKYIVPTLTSNTSSSLGFAFASSIWGAANGAWKAFDGLDTTWYSSASSVLTGHLGFSFNSQVPIDGYIIKSSPSNTVQFSQMVKSWTLQGSNDTTNGTDGQWDILDIQVNQTWSLESTSKIYPTNIKVPYKSYRINFTENNGATNTTAVSEFILFTNEKTALQLKHNYNYEMTQDSSWTDTGSLHRKKITRSEWLRIDRIEVTDSE